MARLPPALRPMWPLAKRSYTAVTRVVAPINSMISRRRGGHLPIGIAMTLDDAVAGTAGGRLEVVRPMEVISRSAPRGVPAPPGLFGWALRDTIPRQAVAELPGGRVLGPHRAVVSGSGSLVHEVSRYFGTTRPREHPLFLHPSTTPPADLDGRLGVLASRGDLNYCHFLFDVLPRMRTAELAADIAPPDRWYVPAELGFQRELLTTWGLATDDIIDSSRAHHVRAETLVVPTVPDMDLNAPPWIAAYLRQRLLPAGVALVPGRRIYVTRGTRRHTRIVTNEDQVVPALEGLGFVVIDPGAMTVTEQVRAFAAAETIVAPHGAALANLAFASPGASVVELFAPRYVQSCYWKLADSIEGLEYRYVVGRGAAPRPKRMWGLADDIDVEVAALKQVLDELGCC